METIADVAVGPGSAAGASTSASSTSASTSASAAPSASASGTSSTPTTVVIPSLVTQALAVRTEHLRRESPQHYPDNDLVRIYEMLAWIPAVPALGLRVFDPCAVGGAESPAHSVRIESDGDALLLTNGLVTVSVTMNGATLQVGNRVLRNLVSLESTRDVGDSYTASLRGEPIQLEVTRIRRVLAGPLRGSIEMRHVHPDGGVTARVTISLDANASHVGVTVRGYNTRPDQRLRLHVSTHVNQPTVYADAAFGPVHREPTIVDERASAVETPPPTMPLHRWISASNATGGVAVISDGLAEAEAGDGFVAVTLLRAIDQLSRNDLPERPGHAGWPAPIPNAQSIGAFTARFGVVVHQPWSVDTVNLIEQAADAVLLPLAAESSRDLDGRERTVPGIDVRGAALRCQAFMPAQDGNGAVLRIVNVSATSADGRVAMPDVNLDYCMAALDETPTSSWQPAHAELPITVPPHGVLTLRLRARQ